MSNTTLTPERWKRIRVWCAERSISLRTGYYWLSVGKVRAVTVDGITFVDLESEREMFAKAPPYKPGRRRGNPPSVTAVPPVAPEQPQKRRGRPPGSKNKPKDRQAGDCA